MGLQAKLLIVPYGIETMVKAKIDCARASF